MHERSWPSFIIRFILRLAFFFNRAHSHPYQGSQCFGIAGRPNRKRGFRKVQVCTEEHPFVQGRSSFVGQSISMNEALEIVGQAFDEVIQEV